MAAMDEESGMVYEAPTLLCTSCRKNYRFNNEIFCWECVYLLEHNPDYAHHSISQDILQNSAIDLHQDDQVYFQPEFANTYPAIAASNGSAADADEILARLCETFGGKQKSGVGEALLLPKEDDGPRLAYEQYQQEQHRMLSPPGVTIPQSDVGLMPKVRRRLWTDRENRAFVEWINKNPKPSADEKRRYAGCQSSLTVQQLQNKINNWRNERKVQQGNGQLTSRTKLSHNTAASQIKSPSKKTVTIELTEPDGATPKFYACGSSGSDSSIERYLQSPELSASSADIEKAVHESGNTSQTSQSRGFWIPDFHQTRNNKITSDQASHYSYTSSARNGSSRSSIWSRGSQQSFRAKSKLMRRARSHMRKTRYFAAKAKQSKEITPQKSITEVSINNAGYRSTTRLHTSDSQLDRNASNIEDSNSAAELTERIWESILDTIALYTEHACDYEMENSDELRKAVSDIIALSRGNVQKPLKESNLLRPQPRSRERANWCFCTFCGEGFDNQFSWVRHEQLRHLQSSSWTCMLTGPFDISSNSPRCAFCGENAPSTQHLVDRHDYLACLGQSEERRKFSTKNRFMNHLKEVHGCELPHLQALDQWKRVEECFPLWRCGICLKAGFWQSSRQSHMLEHWRAGCTLADWKDVDPNMFPIESQSRYEKLVFGPDGGWETYAAKVIPFTTPSSGAQNQVTIAQNFHENRLELLARSDERKMPISKTVCFKSPVSVTTSPVSRRRENEPKSTSGLFASVGRALNKRFRWKRNTDGLNQA